MILLRSLRIPLRLIFRRLRRIVLIRLRQRLLLRRRSRRRIRRFLRMPPDPAPVPARTIPQPQPSQRTAANTTTRIHHRILIRASTCASATIYVRAQHRCAPACPDVSTTATCFSSCFRLSTIDCQLLFTPQSPAPKHSDTSPDDCDPATPAATSPPYSYIPASASKSSPESPRCPAPTHRSVSPSPALSSTPYPPLNIGA